MIFNQNIVEEINDDYLFLRKVSKSDASFLYNSLNKKVLTAYLSLGPLKTLEHSRRLIKNYLKYWDKYLQFNYIIELVEEKRKKIGSISLWNVNWRHLRAEIGVWLIPSYWNKGYGKRALNLIKIIGFNHLKLNRLEVHIAAENFRSITLFKNCGFVQEGLLKKYLLFNENYCDAVILSLLRNNLGKNKRV